MLGLKDQQLKNHSDESVLKEVRHGRLWCGSSKQDFWNFNPRQLKLEGLNLKVDLYHNCGILNLEKGMLRRV